MYVSETVMLQMVCEGTGAPDERIRIASFTCLHEIAANYYAKLPAYMGEIFNISVKAIQEDVEEVGLQAVEFWSTLCDIELELADEDDPSDVSDCVRPSSSVALLLLLDVGHDVWRCWLESA